MVARSPAIEHLERETRAHMLAGEGPLPRNPRKRAASASGYRHLGSKLGGGEGIRTPGGATPTAVFKTGSERPGCGRLRRNGTLRELAVDLLLRMQDGTCTSRDVARLAADVLAKPPPVMAAAQRYLREVGGQHEAAAAVELLGLLAGAVVCDPAADEGVS
ncbi:MAG: hypothetical protein JWN04_1588 [Myxococcaceae bacterium]|nr:hypothetical protein [Myxococcaceae bacterium]